MEDKLCRKANILPGLPILIFLCILLYSCKPEADKYGEWKIYKGGNEANNYSSLKQISKSNVEDLQVAWSFYPSDEPDGFRIWKYECNPIVINGVMYLTSAWRKLYALDATTGQELWSFDPLQGERGGGVLRGVTYWKDSLSEDERIFFSARSKLFAIDANTGQPISEFGEMGSISLELAQPDREEPGTLRLSTPGIIYKDLIITGAVVSESPGAAPGPVRAYSVRTGELAWTFNTIPKPGELGYDTWPEDAYKTSGGANNWAGMSLDETRGVVYIPTGSPTYDYYAADRIGSNLFGNCLIALDAATGKYLWHFQTVHHDLWDYDLPTAPNLITVKKGNKNIDAVAQPTKMGFIYVLDRVTGAPVFPIEERSVPSSNIPGEEAWPTQPFPLKPKSFSKQSISDSDIMAFSEESYESNKQYINDLWFNGLYTPLDFKTTIMFPGSRGGGEWGGAAYDPVSGTLFINSNQLPELGRIEKVRLNQNKGETLFSSGQAIYLKNCASCHGIEKQGVESMPALVGLEQRLTRDEMIDVISRGNGMMPSFGQLLEQSQEELLAYLTDTGKDVAVNQASEQDTTSTYRNVINKNLLVDSLGRPMIKPPWGTLHAINLNTGDYNWSVALGNHPEFQKPGEPATGMENYGGPVVTAGGLVIIGATMDRMLRAFDKDTGAVIWEEQLPGNGLANPSVYQVDGRQYIAIAVSIGESFNHTKCGIITYALPDNG